MKTQSVKHDHSGKMAMINKDRYGLVVFGNTETEVASKFNEASKVMEQVLVITKK